MSGNKRNTTESDKSGDSGDPGEAAVAADIEHKGNKKKREIGGRDGPDPTRYGDWEKNGRCIDF